jgi:hypothetical protein
VRRLTGLLWSIRAADSIRQALEDGSSASIDLPLTPDHAWFAPTDAAPDGKAPTSAFEHACGMARFLLGSAKAAPSDSPEAASLLHVVTGATAAGSIGRAAILGALEAELRAADRMFWCSSGAKRCSADVC